MQNRAGGPPNSGGRPNPVTGGHSAGPPERKPQAPPAQRPSKYLGNGYFEGEEVKCEIVTDWARRKAEAFANKRIITSTQLYRFYSRILSARRKLERPGADFAGARADLCELPSLAANFVGKSKDQWERANREEFKDFIDENVEWAVKDARHLKAFARHFQAIVAFFKYYESWRGRSQR